jgi:hypothetical protein
MAPPMLTRPYLVEIYHLAVPKTKIVKGRSVGKSTHIPAKVFGEGNMSVAMAETHREIFHTTTGRTPSDRPNIANRGRSMSKGGSGSHWDGCEESHHDCAIKKLRAAEKRVEELSHVGYEYTCRDGHTETEVFDTEEVGDAYAEMRFRAERAEYEIELLRSEKGLPAHKCPECGAPWEHRNGRCIHCWVNETDRVRSAISAEVAALERIINPPPPPPDAVHVSSFGSAGAGIVESHWNDWAKQRKAILEEALK